MDQLKDNQSLSPLLCNIVLGVLASILRHGKEIT